MKTIPGRLFLASCAVLPITILLCIGTTEGAVAQALNQASIAAKLHERGDSLARWNEHDKAIPYLEEAVKQDPKLTKAWVVLGYCLARKGNVERALEALRHAVELEPVSPDGHFSLANVLAMAGRNQEAIASYTEALRLKPDFRNARVGLGLSQLAVGDEASARRQQLFLEVSEARDDEYSLLSMVNYQVLLDFIGKPARKHPPFDEASKDSSFTAFRARLLQAVRKRNVPFLLSAIDGDVYLASDGTSGIAEFKKMWSPYNKDSPVWKVMEKALSLGGAWSQYGKQRVFEAPYVRERFPYRWPDNGFYSVALGDNVKLYPRPDISAEPIASLSYDVVMLDLGRSIYREQTKTDKGWYRVVTAQGKVGFIPCQQVDASSAYYMEFHKIKGSWKICGFQEYQFINAG